MVFSITTKKRSEKPNNNESNKWYTTSDNKITYEFVKLKELSSNSIEILEEKYSSDIKNLINKFSIFFNKTYNGINSIYNTKWHIDKNIVYLEIIFKKYNFYFPIFIVDTMLSFIILNFIDFNYYLTFYIFNFMINSQIELATTEKKLEFSTIKYIPSLTKEYRIPKIFQNNYAITNKIDKDIYNKFKLEDKLDITFDTLLETFVDYMTNDDKNSYLNFNFYTDITQSYIGENSNLVFRYEGEYFMLYLFEIGLLIKFLRNNKKLINIKNFFIYSRNSTDINGNKRFSDKIKSITEFHTDLYKNLPIKNNFSIVFKDNNDLKIAMDEHNNENLKAYEMKYNGPSEKKIMEKLNELKNKFSNYLLGFLGSTQKKGGNSDNDDNYKKYLKYKQKYLQLKNSQ